MALLDEEALTHRILDHVAAGTTDLADETWREPVEHYRCPDRLRQETELVLRRRFVAYCPSVALPRAGSYIARTAAGTPLVVLRDREGQVRAFRNACRHRGAALVAGCGTATSLVCPYHGWVYRLDGALRHVADDHGFPGLDRATHGLVPVTAVERSGLVFVSQDGADAGELADLPEIVLSDQMLLDSSTDVVEANWKILVEGFLEGYHIKATHRSTFFPFGYDNLNVVESFEQGSRVVFPFRRIEGLRDVPSDQRSLDGLVTTVHHVFPNVMVARLSHHTAVVVLEPDGVERTNVVTYRLTNEAGADESHATRDAKFVEMGNEEDRDMARSVQQGLSSGANEFLEFGRFEGAIIHFHRQLAALIA
ncbi:aromatic ring-hydroxylating oxygenase subunit alpha [Pseudonocardia spinosispora]|uniref:aromatic ring-hydroxylating oxygenase subunit alpha n=1 Tax=Pseudonocardia spinosispora TaxID=103441 RepID=UPI00041AA8F4|nr:aromatic ring-hydroxylating dioxygenase subunit alpha [Pseudonocardia spinosispora]